MGRVAEACVCLSAHELNAMLSEGARVSVSSRKQVKNDSMGGEAAGGGWGDEERRGG